MSLNRAKPSKMSLDTHVSLQLKKKYINVG